MQGQGGDLSTWSIAVHYVCSYVAGYTVPEVSRVVQAKARPHLCFAQGQPARDIEQSEMAVSYLALEISM